MIIDEKASQMIFCATTSATIQNVLFLFVSRSQISIHPTYSQRCDIFKERSSRCPIDRREQSLRWQNPEIAKEEQESGVFPGFPTAGPLSARPGSDKHFRKIAHKFGAFVHETVAADSNVGSNGFCDFSMSLEYMYIVECGMYHELDCGSCL